jgi:serine/threonine protein kinase
MAELTNTRIGRYEVRERIGAGGMARVYKAWDTNLEREVAVKIMYEHLAEDATFKQRFEREAKAVAALNHPNIMQIYDFDSFMRDGEMVFYMVMAFIPGQSLKAVLEKREAKDERLPDEQILAIMSDILMALGYAHERGMIHRDVKPANIMFDERGKAILTDFGIARLAQGGNRLTRESSTVGTPAYMSPEQAVGGEVDARGDLYSAGIMLYEMLTGKTPFADDGSLSVLLKHLNEPVPMLSSVSAINNPALETVLLHALAKKADMRYQTADEFLRDLQAAFKGESVSPIPLDLGTKVLNNGISQATIPAPAATQTQPTLTRTITLQLPTPEQARQLAPIGILLFGLVLILMVVAANLFNRAQIETTSDDNSTVNAMTDNSDTVDAMTEASALGGAFASSFASDDTTNGFWEIGNTAALRRDFTTDGQYRLFSRDAGTGITSIAQGDYSYDFVTITMRASLTVDTPAAAGYGIVYHYQDNNNYHVFTVDGEGRYSIWRREDGRWTELRRLDEQWTPNDAILPAGEFNMLKVTVRGVQFVAEVNGTVVVTIEDTTFGNGKIGIYLATAQDEGSATLLVDDYTVTPGVPAMTDPPLGLSGGR